MLELIILKILLQISISLLHSVPKCKPKVPNLGGVYTVVPIGKFTSTVL